MNSTSSPLDWKGDTRTPAALLVRGSRLLDPASGVDHVTDLLVRNGRIAEIGDQLELPQEGDAREIDAGGMLLTPGFVDPHVHLRTPGRESAETIATGTAAAAAGGYCAVFAQPNTEPVIDTVEIVQALRARATAEAVIPTGLLAAVTRGQQGEALVDFTALANAGVAGFTDDGRPVRSARILRQALLWQQVTGLPIALHEEDIDLSAGGAMHEGAVSARLGIAGIPSSSEASMIARDVVIAGEVGGHIHVQHVSARASVERIEEARARGVRVTAEVSPHHLLLTDDDVETANLDARWKMNPPLRSSDDRAALVDALRRGAFDCIATDHAPHGAAAKEVPIDDAAFGITGLETSFAALHTGLVLPGLVPLEVIVDRLSSGAPIFGIARPTIAVGAVANLTIIDLRRSWQVGEHGYHSRSVNTPWHGVELTGRVLLSMAAGVVTHDLLTEAVPA